MSREMTNSESIANLNHIYGFVSPNIQRSLDVAFKALEERPQGDLKSCEALKAYAREVLCGDNPTNSLLIRMFDEIIDNTPTVSERPQGKWEVDKHGEHFCPKCGHYALYEEDQENDYYEVQSNFCPECGADLKGCKG